MDNSIQDLGENKRRGKTKRRVRLENSFDIDLAARKSTANTFFTTNQNNKYLYLSRFITVKDNDNYEELNLNESEKEYIKAVIFELCSNGATVDNIASILKLKASYLIKEFETDFLHAYSNLQVNLRKLQFAMAANGSVDMAKHLGKFYLGQKDEKEAAEPPKKQNWVIIEDDQIIEY